MGDQKIVKTGSMGRNVDEVKTVGIKGQQDSVDSADEQVEKQAESVPGPSESLSADKDVEANNG